jgi:hypothetical protein
VHVRKLREELLGLELGDDDLRGWLNGEFTLPGE